MKQTAYMYSFIFRYIAIFTIKKRTAKTLKYSSTSSQVTGRVAKAGLNPGINQVFGEETGSFGFKPGNRPVICNCT